MTPIYALATPVISPANGRIAKISTNIAKRVPQSIKNKWNSLTPRQKRITKITGTVVGFSILSAFAYNWLIKNRKSTNSDVPKPLNKAPLPANPIPRADGTPIHITLVRGDVVEQ